MAQKSIIAADRRQEQELILEQSSNGVSQNITITDIVSEGEIKGLVNGGASIYFNEDSLFEDDETDYQSFDTGAGSVVATGTTNSTTVTLSGDTKQSITESGHRLLAIKNALEAQVSLSNGLEIYSGRGVYWTLTASSGIFHDDFAAVTGFGYSFEQAAAVHGDGLFALNTLSKGTIYGTISNINETNTTCTFTSPDVDYEEFEDETVGTRGMSMDLYLRISSITPTSIILDDVPPISFTNKHFEITAGIANTSSNTATPKYPGSRYEIVTGTQSQGLFSSGKGEGVTSVALAIPTPALKRGTSSTITGGATLQGGQAAEVDEVSLLFQYPQGISHAGGTKGTIGASAVAYRIEVGVLRGSTWSYEKIKGAYGPDIYSTYGNSIGSGTDTAGASNEGEFVTGHRPWGTGGEGTQRPISVEMSIDLAPYQPFSDFKIIITRLTNHGSVDGGVDYTGPVAGPGNNEKMFYTYSVADYNESSQGVLTIATAIIKEKLNYPFTAMINTKFNSKQFGSVPKRSYELFGMLLQVPSNYVTREENTEETTYPGMVATYNRSTSTGEATNTSQPWDGNFRSGKVYTNNPAWVFYDILVNNRYGLGGFLKSTHIDKFSLYKIAKYCDELVPDGKGSKEPRFTANLYLQKSTDAYKVLKDMATIFRGMLYWIDGTVRPVIDEKKPPVYNFSKANVIDGQFSYEGTGSKTRSNQYIVTWNNPETGYKLEPLLLEDKQNIAETGRIISQTAMAFGCTSEGQALRYGRWKLWTTINQTEIVSFATGEGAAFLVPGDVVNIQDADDYGIPFSGRVSSYSEVGNPTITLDRDIDVYLHSSDYTYTISVIVPKTIAILNQDSATIGATSYTRGDTIVQARLSSGGSQSNIVVSDSDTTNLNANNALDDSNDFLTLVLRESTIVQERALTGTVTIDSVDYTLDSAAAEGRTKVRLTEALDEEAASDLKETLWVIKQTKTSSSQTSASSPKQYKILSVSDDGEGTHSIVAVEHYNEKFDSIENDFNLAIDDTVYPPEPLGTPPSPTNLRMLRVPERTLPGEEIIVQWDAPAYEHIRGYEVTHFFNKERVDEVRTILNSQKQVAFGGIEEGRYRVAVRTISNFNKKSKPVVTAIDIKDIFSNNVPRINGIQKGCISTSPVQMTLDASDVKTDNVFFVNGSYTIAPLNAVEGDGYINVLKSNDTSNANSISQSVTEVSESDWAGQFTSVGNFASVFYDYSEVSSSSNDPIKLISWKVDSDLGVSYWYDADKYAANTASIWTALSGTVSVAANSNKVVGTNTSFTSLEVTNVLKFSSTFGASVAYIESDTVMYISSTSTSAVAAGTTAYKDELNVDYRNDFLLGEVSYISSAYNFSSYVSVRKDQIDDARAITVTANHPVLSYDGDGDLQTDYPNLKLTIQAIGFNNPEIKVTGSGYNATDQSAETSYTNASSRTVTVHAAAYNQNPLVAYSNGDTLDFTIEAREKDNTSRARTVYYSITKTIDSGTSATGFNATASNLDHTFRMNSDGVVTSNDFSSIISVIKAGNVNTYAASGTEIGTYGVTISAVTGMAANEVIVTSTNSQAYITLSGTADILDTPATVAGGFKATIIDRGDNDKIIATYKYNFIKIPLITRTGVTLTLSMTASEAAEWKGTLGNNNATAIAVAAAVIASSAVQPDGLLQTKRIVTGDRITVVNGTTVATRVYTGSATAASGGVVNAYWSSVVIAEFDGSVIVDGTLSADKITSGELTSGTVTVSNNLVLGAGGSFYSWEKTSFADTSNGLYMDGTGDFAVGGTGGSLKYDQSENLLTFDGTFKIGSSTVDDDYIAGKAPVQKVNGSTGEITISAAGLNIQAGNVGGLGNLATLDTLDSTNSALISGLGSLASKDAIDATSDNITKLLGSATVQDTFDDAAKAAAPIQGIEIEGVAVEESTVNLTAAGLAISTETISDWSTAIDGFINITSAMTDITAGKILLASGNLTFTKSTDTLDYQLNDSILLDVTSGGTNTGGVIEIRDGSNVRVKIGKL